MHRSLQDAGCRTEYFDHTETEFQGILAAVLRRVEYNNPVINETGDALSKGEISTGKLRDIEASYQTLLSQLGVYPCAHKFESNKRTVSAQIDEGGFQTLLKNEALRKKMGYSIHNIENDAQSLGNIMRLRGRKRVPTLVGAGFVFVTHNGFLTATARRFIADKRYENYGWNYAPPFFTDEQITTYVWLLTKREFKQESVSRELLANCYEAIRPDVDWTERFFEKIREFEDFDPDLAAENADQALWLSTARRVAEDSSHGNTAILGQLPITEILAKAEKLTEEKLKSQREVAERELGEASIEAKNAGRLEQEAQIRAAIKKKSEKIGFDIAGAISILVTAAAIWLFLSPPTISSTSSWIDYLPASVGAVLAALSTLSLFNITPLSHLRTAIAKRAERIMLSFISGGPD